MKLLKTYKQDTTTWVVYSCLFQYIKLDKLYIHKAHAQHSLDNWMRSIPAITMRTKYEDS